MDWIPAFMSYTWWSAYAVFRASETIVRSMVFNNGLYDVDFKPLRAKKASSDRREASYSIQNPVKYVKGASHLHMAASFWLAKRCDQ